ncbi:MAG: Bax inhibitor-1/YccA family protein [Asticcacaulis sp.]|nr:Bax inhibitor-1/YccA family protein [Asticcacaulis sp.]
MADFDQLTGARPYEQDMSKDIGLRNFMLGVYLKMALGLLLTGTIAWVVANVPAVRDYFFVMDAAGTVRGITLLGMIAQWMPLVIILGSMLVRAVTPRSSGILYWAIVSAIGLSGAAWFLIYRLGDIANIFLVTASAFGAMSLWGYTTKRDLRPFGTFLFMSVWGIVILMIGNALFFHNEMFRVAVAAVGVLLFAGFTAYDTQKIKSVYYAIGGSQTRMAVATNMGALNFYLDFINMFQLLLSIFGSRR